nr:hypothetical protein [Trueperaceae bacterium]
MNVDLNPGRRPDDDPHAVHEPLRHGPAAEDAPVGMVLIHGRGDSARGILSLAEQLEAR